MQVDSLCAILALQSMDILGLLMIININFFDFVIRTVHPL